MNKLKIGEDMKIIEARSETQMRELQLEQTDLMRADYQSRYRKVKTENEHIKRELDVFALTKPFILKAYLQTPKRINFKLYNIVYRILVKSCTR